MRKNRIRRNGFSLTEIIAVMAVISILAAILIPIIGGMIRSVQTNICHMNMKKANDYYEAWLLVNRKDHNEMNYRSFCDTYTQKLCPIGGDPTYSNETILCSIHATTDDFNDKDPTEVPYLGLIYERKTFGMNRKQFEQDMRIIDASYA